MTDDVKYSFGNIIGDEIKTQQVTFELYYIYSVWISTFFLLNGINTE